MNSTLAVADTKMTDIESPRVKSFVTSTLPWLLGALMLAVYLITLNHWVTPNGLNEIVDIENWSLRPHAFGPVTFIVTYPFRWLPASSIPLALNLFSAACGALALGLLARSVSLLPHDRTYDQRQREQSEFSILSIPSAWLPPVFAVLVCGLQMTFWENAIEATGEMFDLLLFSYAIRCLLEYRTSGKDSWLVKSAFVYVAAMVNNPFLIGLFPAYAAAVIWIKGLDVLHPRFILQMGLCALGGLLFLSLYPLVSKFSDPSHPGFWQTLRAIVGYDKSLVQHFPRITAAVLALTSVLPVLVMGIRWASSFGDNSPLGIFMATATFHIVHALFLVACLWTALDSTISGRQMAVKDPYLGMNQIRCLPLYYLGAISVGYFSGYFLLLFGPTKSRRPQPPVLNTLKSFVVVGVWLLAIAVPALLVYKNLPHLQGSKMVSRAYENHFAQIEQLLPSKASVVLSDDPFRLYYLEAALTRHAQHPTHLLIDTAALERQTNYLNFLQKANPGFQILGPWTNIPPTAPPVLAFIQLFDHLSLDHAIFYIQPSFGYYFEAFYPEPHGLIYQLKSYPSNTWDAPLPTAALISENQAFWKKTQDEVTPPLVDMLQKIMRTSKSDWEKFLNRAGLKMERDWLASPVGAYYARALNEWGVELQAGGHLDEAGKAFEGALLLNTNNLAAHLNKSFNKDLAAGKAAILQPLQDAENTIFSQRNGWSGALTADGPIDNPSFRDNLAAVLASGGNYRQAVQQLDRVKALVPDDPRPPVQLAQLLIYIQSLTNGLFQVLPWTECYADALQNTEQALRIHPDETNALFWKSVALVQLKSYDQALQSLNHLLAMPSQASNYAAILNRAIVNYKLGNFAAAKPDYETVGHVAPNAYQVYYGLGEIAFRQNDNEAAIKNYELYLTNAPPGSEESKFISERLKKLKSGSP